jgi:putative transposase
VLAVPDSPRFADKAVAQACTILLDEGRYLCSQATMHRLPRERGTSGDRRARAVHPARKKPELLAAGVVLVAAAAEIAGERGPSAGAYPMCHSPIAAVVMPRFSR